LEPRAAASERAGVGGEADCSRREPKRDPIRHGSGAAPGVRLAFLDERGVRKARLLFAVRTGTVLSATAADLASAAESGTGAGHETNHSVCVRHFGDACQFERLGPKLR